VTPLFNLLQVFKKNFWGKMETIFPPIIYDGSKVIEVNGIPIEDIVNELFGEY
jgi:hypothetical protein